MIYFMDKKVKKIIKKITKNKLKLLGFSCSFFSTRLSSIIAIVLLLALIGFLYVKDQELGQKYEKQSQPSVSLATTTPTPAPTGTIRRLPSINTPTPFPKAIEKPPLPVLNGSSIFNMVNTFRASNGKPFLSVSDELCRLAEARADYMMSNKMTAFKSSKTNGHTGFTNAISQYSGSGVGENLAANVSADMSVIEIWKNSPPHKELMLSVKENDTQITKGCIATRVSEIGSIVVLLVGDK